MNRFIDSYCSDILLEIIAVMRVNEDRDFNWYPAARVHQTQVHICPRWVNSSDRARIQNRILSGSGIDFEMFSMHDSDIGFAFLPFPSQA